MPPFFGCLPVGFDNSAIDGSAFLILAWIAAMAEALIDAASAAVGCGFEGLTAWWGLCCTRRCPDWYIGPACGPLLVAMVKICRVKETGKKIKP